MDYFFESGNFQELSTLIESLIGDSNKMDILAQRGFQKVKRNYDWSKIVEKMVEFYELGSRNAA